MILKDKIAVVTGGSRGIGKAVVQALTAEGCRVVAVSRSSDELTALKDELEKTGLRIDVQTTDVSDYQQVKKLMNETLKKFGAVDILINAAGIYGPIGLFGDNDIKKWTDTIQINLVGTANCVHAVLPAMMKNKAGKIINFSGGGAVNSFPRFSGYATSKAAIVRFTENLAEEYKQHNIQINSIAPGAVNTKLFDESLDAGKEAVGEKFYKKIIEQKQTGGDSPQLAADLILFIISSNLTGKLVSAKWDNWKEWSEAEVEHINNSSEYTLRRIDNKYFQEIKKQ
jgi:NAD(P)-dependent dehydrogenase (short-subunit alcohol dehydrogenase family)